MAAENGDKIPPNLRLPGAFHYQKPELWIHWLKRFERFIIAANLTDRTESEKIDLLCFAMGVKSVEILAEVMPEGTKQATYAEVKQKFCAYFSPKKNIILERFKFNSRVQRPQECVDEFVAALYTLAKSCDYGQLKDDLIRDRIVVGVSDPCISEKLQLIDDLTVEKATEIARQAEMQARQSEMTRQVVQKQNEVNKVSRKKKSHRRKK